MAADRKSAIRQVKNLRYVLRCLTGEAEGGGVEEAGAATAKEADEFNIFDAVDVEFVVERFPVVGDGDGFKGAFASSAEDDAISCFRARGSQAFGAGFASEFVLARFEQDGAAPCTTGAATVCRDDEGFMIVLNAPGACCG